MNDTVGTLAGAWYSNKDVVDAVILVSIIELINCFLFFPVASFLLSYVLHLALQSLQHM